MKILALNNNYNANFKSLRTDKNDIATLKNGSMPILENKKENILAALGRMANNPERENIEFLLDIAQNIQYGQKGDSEFKAIIDETTDYQQERENTDWLQLLSDTIQQALSKSTEDISDLEAQYKKFFGTKHPMSEQQKRIIDLRNQLKKIVVNSNSIDDTDSLTSSAKASQGIDLFISSSEISLEQKQECLEKLLYFFSDDYHINPQLADKKVEIVNEMLDDLLIKVPGREILTTKGVNQLYSGICAAISICRKAVGYENKSRYIDIVLEELKDSPTMEVYDVTDLESGRKVNIPKINIDYDTAISQGYRILDASAHHWMHNAHSSGDGTIQSETYTAFENETCGVFNDSSWYEGLNPKLSAEKELLKCLIKANEYLKSVLKQKKEIKSASQGVSEAKKKSVQVQSQINGELNNIFSDIFPEMSAGDKTRLIRSIINFYNGSQPNNEVNISSKMAPEVKQYIIADFIKKQTNIAPSDEKTIAAIEENSNRISELVEYYTNEDNSIKKLSNFSSSRAKFQYYQQLFRLAVSHRLALESDVNLNTGVVRFEKVSGLPVRTKQITSYLKRLEGSIDANQGLERFSQGKTKEQVKKDLLYDIYRVEHVIPKQLDDICKTMFDISTKEQTKQLLMEVRSQIKFGRKDLASVVASVSGIKQDRVQIINYLDKWIKKFDGDISDEELDEAIRIIGFEDRIHMFKSLLSQYVTQLSEGISEEEMKGLISRYGSEDKILSSLQAQQRKFNKLLAIYYDIQERWDVPSARQLIIDKMEKDQKILSVQEIEILNRKFADVRSQRIKNEQIENLKERQKSNRKLYEFNNNELDVLMSIERALPFIKKYCKTEYNALNKELFDDLEKQYANIGMLNGQFWVREEGSSGLSANEQIRIIEQMTGTPYHIEQDIDRAVQQVKKGDGSGIINYSVDDNSYAFHAQYVPSVTSEEFTSPRTKQIQKKYIVWTDNSWGKSEQDSFWNGRDGFKYTDYGSGYGWKNGFVLADDLRIGTSVDSIKNTIGVDSKDKTEFSLFLDMILKGTPVDAYQKLYKMFSYILSMDQGMESYAALEDALKSGNTVNVESLEGLDNLVEDKTENLYKQINKIKTKEDFDKLPKDSYLRFILETLSVYMATNNPNLADNVLLASSREDLEKIKENMLEDLISEIGSIICKSDDTIEKLLISCNADITSVFDKIQGDYNVELDETKRAYILRKIFLFEGNKDRLESLDGSLNKFEAALLDQTVEVAAETIENEDARQFFIENVQGIIKKEVDSYLRIKSLDSLILVNSPLHDEFIASIDKYLSPKSDEDLLDLLIGFQNAGYEEVNKFLNILDFEDVGLHFKDPYEYIKLLKEGDTSVAKAFGQIIASNVISSEITYSPSNKPIETIEDDDYTEMYPEDLYRVLYVKLSELDVQKYIRDFKAEAFLKYKVRQAFPQPIIIKDDEMAKTCSEMYEYFGNLLGDIRKNNYIISVFDQYSKLVQKLKLTGMYELLEQGESFTIDFSMQKDYKEIINFLRSYSNLLAEDESLNLIKEPVDSLLSVLMHKSSVDAKAAMEAISEIERVFTVWASSNVVKERFLQDNKENINEIKNNVLLFVNSNIIPKYRNDAIERIYRIINMMRDGKFDEDLQYEENEFIDFFINRHILKDPTKLLSECVKMIQEGKDDTQEYDILKRYLIKTLKIAQQTKAQYKMVQNAHDGISSKTKELLSLFSVKLNDGTSKPMDSEIGMIYLVNQLENESDDYTTLKLFLAQSGLSKLALRALLNNSATDRTRKVVEETADEISQDLNDFEFLNQQVEQYTNMKKTPSKTFEEAVLQFKSYIEGKIKKDKQSIVFENFLKYFGSIKIKPELRNIDPEMIMPLLLSLIQDAVTYTGEKVNDKIDYLAGISKIIEERKVLIDLIDVPKDSEEYKMREDFQSHYDQLNDYIYNKLTFIRERIEGSNFMSVQIVTD